MAKALEGQLDLDAVGDVRGIGLLWAVEFVADKVTKKPFVRKRTSQAKSDRRRPNVGCWFIPCKDVWTADAGDHLLLAPPAVITKEQIEWAVAS